MDEKIGHFKKYFNFCGAREIHITGKTYTGEDSSCSLYLTPNIVDDEEFARTVGNVTPGK